MDIPDIEDILEAKEKAEKGTEEERLKLRMTVLSVNCLNRIFRDF